MTRVEFTTVAIIAAIIALGGPAHARITQDQCSGILHHKGQELWFGGERGEGESICVIAAGEAPKVLRVCAPGSYCRVIGSGGDCEGSGECMEIKRVVAVSARHDRPRR